LPSAIDGLGVDLVYEHTRRRSRIDSLRETDNLHSFQTRISYDF
jgi:hypothetical protein